MASPLDKAPYFRYLIATNGWLGHKTIAFHAVGGWRGPSYIKRICPFQASGGPLSNGNRAYKAFFKVGGSLLMHMVFANLITDKSRVVNTDLGRCGLFLGYVGNCLMYLFVDFHVGSNVIAFCLLIRDWLMIEW